MVSPSQCWRTEAEGCQRGSVHPPAIPPLAFCSLTSIRRATCKVGPVPTCLCLLSPLSLAWRGHHGREESGRALESRLEFKSEREKTHP